MSHEIGNINNNMDKYIKICLKCNFKKASLRLDYVMKESDLGSREFDYSLGSAWARLAKVSVRLGIIWL